jgi:hypothetical protein
VVTEMSMLPVRPSPLALCFLALTAMGCADPCGDYLEACIACGNSEAECQASIDAADGDEDACQAALDDIEAVGGCK